ncbi:MAG: hypothetical protein HC804_02675 [Anaerolineae bacterium]|nr:hypothetical protein [Anaerolineae bacterium]
MRKTNSILVIGLSSFGLLLMLVLAISGSVSARTTETGASVAADPNNNSSEQSSANSLSNFDARGSFHTLSGPTAGDPLTIALNFIQNHSEALGVTTADVADLVVTDQYVSQHSGVTHIYLQQQVDGIRVETAV